MNKKYKVEITETLQKVIEIEAVSETEALNKVRKLYCSEEIILDDTAYVDTKIEIIND